MKIPAPAVMNKAFAAMQNLSRGRKMSLPIATKVQSPAQTKTNSFSKGVFNESNNILKSLEANRIKSGVGRQETFGWKPAAPTLKKSLNSAQYQKLEKTKMDAGMLALRARLDANLGKISHGQRDQYLGKIDAKLKHLTAEADTNLKNNLEQRKQHFSQSPQSSSKLDREIQQLEETLLFEQNKDLQANAGRSNRVSILQDYKADLQQMKREELRSSVKEGFKAVPVVDSKEAARLRDLRQLNTDTEAAFRAETDINKKVELWGLLQKLADEIDTAPEHIFKRT